MCGISGSNAKDRVKWVQSAIKHQEMRGPDSNHYISSDNGWCFGHNRLSIIDLSENSNQPLEDWKGYMLTYNGEIYNYKDFFGHNSDTLTLWRLLLGYGIKDTLQKLNGMFAFAFYCRTGNLYLAVDRFGQKPLYYYHEGSDFYFASTPAALYAIKDKWDLDRDALQSYWLLGSVMGSDGLFKGIKKLCASEMLTYDGTNVKVERYWEPKFQEKTDIEGMVLDAIRKVKVSDVPIHIFLSGGIDSTLVASQFEGGNAIHLDGPERHYAQVVAKKYNIDLKVINPLSIDTEVALKDYSFKCGEPTMSGIIPWIVAREASKFGKVAISANGADELFFGYNRTHDNVTNGQINHIFRDVNRFTLQNHIIEYLTPNINTGRKMELMTYVQFDLNKTLDFASMCHGLEVRNPFLDHRLVEQVLSIPESVHRAKGNKTLLKEILWREGFDMHFTERPKQGFSLFMKPNNLESCISLAWDWVQKEGYLNLEGKVLSGRDEEYLKMSALGFYYWYKVWKHKMN